MFSWMHSFDTMDSEPYFSKCGGKQTRVLFNHERKKVGKTYKYRDGV